jgi:dTDP-4-dehydrorhamnose 3,5-epimerase
MALSNGIRIWFKGIESVLIITPTRHGEHRGFFGETYSLKRYAELGVDVEFVQDNHSLSALPGTMRGLHFQAPPHAQAKLVRCGRGAIFDVVVDIRKGSSTYGHWVGHELTAENGHQIYVPIGFAHGFVTLCTNSEIVYKCSDYYDPETEGALIWNDPEIGIDWPVTTDLTISDKDKTAKLLTEFESPFVFGVIS